MLKNIFAPKKLCTKELCMVGLLSAVTVELGYISGFLRIGSFGKFSVSFISVFMSGALFGPWIGGFVGVTADVISFAVNPAGPFLWQVTLCELLFGFIYGVFFYEHNFEKGKVFYILKITICVVVQLVANIFIKTYALQNAGLMPSDFWVAFVMRLPLCLLSSVAQFVIFFIIYKYIPLMKK